MKTLWLVTTLSLLNGPLLAATNPNERLAMIRSLEAQAPDQSLGAAASAFDWLEGSWNLQCDIIEKSGHRTHLDGTWDFGWIINGLMVQDVIYFFPAGKPAERYGGTSLRMYDSRHKEWDVVFFSPHPGTEFHVALKGARVGDRIILNGSDTDSIPIRWSFNDIRPSSFHWIGERSDDGGKTWWVEQEMFARKR